MEEKDDKVAVYPLFHMAYYYGDFYIFYYEKES